MRTEFIIDIDKEVNLSNQISKRLLEDGYNASNSIIVTVSTDYSSIPGQLIRHNLSHDLEICDGFGIDVPYPDEEWDSTYVPNMYRAITNYSNNITKTLILVEAGVIRGGNYTFVVNYLRSRFLYAGKIITVALFENKESKWKSDYVGEYYDDTIQDLTFSWEKPNKHWPIILVDWGKVAFVGTRGGVDINVLTLSMTSIDTQVMPITKVDVHAPIFYFPNCSEVTTLRLHAGVSVDLFGRSKDCFFTDNINLILKIK